MSVLLIFPAMAKCNITDVYFTEQVVKSVYEEYRRMKRRRLLKKPHETELTIGMQNFHELCAVCLTTLNRMKTK